MAASPSTSLAGVLLAAGRGRRIGRPKALLRWGAETFVARLSRTWAAVCDPVIVVGGAGFDEVKRALQPPAVPVYNPAFEGPMFTSVLAGVAAVPATAGGALLGPVDQPLVDAGLLLDVAAAWREAPERIVVPRHEGRGGHPVVLPRRLFGALLAEPDWSSLERFLGQRGGDIQWLDLPDRPEVLRNINGPEDYRTFMSAALEDEQTRL